ncbi:toll/interleukin-1 receptor domain-containing protein [Microtetraspora sp. NBRC 16547]|uniref:toll/interleukin-1 receptor domain-containing protein n=1 Tax=Microtetraspora sp. NBRC 16547 TaxID=3030993 RepID=UPI0024A05020|nr:toll/interleukin-1 receptor domain-containing protein [Microtetraspora sp. NBRC 16547]GLX01220.1 hypothetical protein Misp02_53060 [Microtetraspora sp. NBRC 16547]
MRQGLRIAVTGHRDLTPATLDLVAAAIHEEIRGHAGGRINSYPPLEEHVRTRWLDAFTRRQPAEHTDILVSYAPEDRMWADWIGAVLRRAGCRVSPQAIGTPQSLDGGEGRGQALVILSTAYVRSPQGRETWERLSAPDLAGNGRPLVSARIADLRLPSPFSDRPPVDLVRHSAEQATDAVLRAVGLDR